MPELTLHQRLIAELKVVRKAGLHRLRERLDELPTLRACAEQASGAMTAEHVEALLRNVYTARSEGAQGTAIGILLGLELGRRGATPTVLRKLAAERLGYYSVDTFRKKPEQNALSTFADLIESYLIDLKNQPKRDDYRIEAALHAIEQLNAVEYAEMIRRLRARYMWFNTDPNATVSQSH
jgi:hypothetical protein